jgi:hypothetical protein
MWSTPSVTVRKSAASAADPDSNISEIKPSLKTTQS